MTPELKALMLEAARIYREWQDAVIEDDRAKRVFKKADYHRKGLASSVWIDAWDAHMEASGKRNDLWGAHLKAEKKLYRMIEKELKHE